MQWRLLITVFALAAVFQPAFADDLAEARKHWAFRTLSRPHPPSVEEPTRTRNSVDRFLLARLEAAKLSFAAEADRTTLIRRAYLDLIGLPPTPAEVAAFEADKSTDPYEKLIDRLLASPHFGERWGRHWLDGAGYVDVVGGDNDAATVKLGENKWLYRDYVIRAFNSDKPFDRFLSEQIAGDDLVRWRDASEFTPEIRECLIATGFLRTAADDTDENELNTLDIRHGVLQRTGEVLANNLLGLTLNCAKCHDHKYEPLTQRDYYQFLALLQPAFNPDKWVQPKQRLLASIPSAEKGASEQASADVAVLTKRLEELKKVDTPSSAIEPYERKLAEAKSKQRKWENWHVVYDSGPPTPTCILRRGDYLRPGAEVAPGFLEVLQSDSIALIPKWDAAPSSGRRLTLAKWLNNADTPAGALVQRVRVNRIWRHLFGRGIVETVDNFGVTGTKPSHPELLDWLAVEFLRGDRRLKPFLKTLVTSAAYRQSSQVDGRSPGKSSDPDNRLLWRMPLRRLESEVVRDSVLSVSGVLDLTMGGPPIPVESKADGSFVPKDGTNPRRSVYLLGRRNYHPTLLGVFDQPVLTTNCTGRQASAVVLQSLAMLNDRFMQEQAKNLASRVKSTAMPGQEIDTAFRIVLGRSPNVAERKIAADLIGKQSGNEALAHLCLVLLNTSEFLYAP